MRTSALAIAAATLASAAAAQDIAQTRNQWFVAGQGAIEQMLALQPNTGTARNVILFVADGNGVGTNYATRVFMGQEAGGMGEDFVLPYETFPNVALIKTYSTNGQTPDSAPTASAMNTGIKTRNDVINVPSEVAVDDCAAGLASSVTTLADIASGMGKSVGIISTARITHATPAAVYARTVNRDWEDDTAIPEGCDQPDIAAQLVTAMESGVVDLALGGGRQHFLPAEATDEEGNPGARADGRNLVEEITGEGGQYAWNTETFNALAAPGNGPVLGLFESSHMQYEHDRTDEPSLAEMTRMAIGALDGNEAGYYLEVEGGRVDHANHAGNLYRAVTDGVAFAQAVQAAMDLTDPAETLIIVTADHEHAIAFNGYCGRGTPIVGLCLDVDPAGEMHLDTPVLGDDGKPYTVAGYLNGAGSVLIEQIPEGETTTTGAGSAATAAGGAAAEETVHVYSGSRPDLTQEQVTDPDYLQQALIPLSSETHSGEDVAAYARGPWAHLLRGSMEQNVLFHVMLTAMNGGQVLPAAAQPGAAQPAATGAAATGEGTSGDDTQGNAQDAAPSGN
ncbi:alkaline phosphatase [Rubellimicrobium arenae]|uniref:alkaline phosphatase n=1 Tax=Rubellimicrobium arenae TaxID=2817372 RepID=UPI001B30FDA8|nr:alkaline phosphatase [Rubellimicrobium arenae]